MKGIKKLENFVKREREIRQWRGYAGPEDIDYFECQLELQQDLLKSYNFVERIIGKGDLIIESHVQVEISSDDKASRRALGGL